MDQTEKMQKMLSVQLTDRITGEAKEISYTLQRLEIPYITKENRIETRPVQLAIPDGVSKPVPLVYVAHYTMDDSASEWRWYLSNGWAVASTVEFELIYNMQLTDNNLVFNNAALYTLRNLPEIDRNRIAVVGGSAGGYMTLMLDGLQLGICCCVANCPVANLHFNFHSFFTAAIELHNATYAALSEEERAEAERLSSSTEQAELYRGMSMAKLPILYSISDFFMKAIDNFSDSVDSTRATALSPIGHARVFSAPFVIIHHTSDGLVPIDQISRRFTYPSTGKSLPESFHPRLPDPPKVTADHSLEELLPADRISVKYLPAETAVIDLPFDPDKDYTLDIFDEGPMESYSGHRLIDAKGGTDNTCFIKEMFRRGAAATVRLSEEKLKLLLQRYDGESIALPPRTGIDDTVYGSLAVYRQEIQQELADWVLDHSVEAYREVLDRLTEREKDPAVREKLHKTGLTVAESFV